MNKTFETLLEHPIAATILISATLSGIAEIVKAVKAK